MPASRYFTVTQTREVKVNASTAVDAARIADCAFNNGQTDTLGAKGAPSDVWGNTRTPIKVTELVSREDY